MAALHQTTTLSPGRHRSPRDGACAMELASLLAGERRFSDHPSRVCAVLAAFLRGYNDATSTRRRQDLFALAATVVDSRVDDPAIREARANALIAHAVDAWRHRGRLRFALPPSLPAVVAYNDVEAAGAYVGRLARHDAALHARTADLIEMLVRSRAAAPPVPEPGDDEHPATDPGGRPVAPQPA